MDKLLLEYWKKLPFTGNLRILLRGNTFKMNYGRFSQHFVLPPNFSDDILKEIAKVQVFNFASEIIDKMLED